MFLILNSFLAARFQMPVSRFQFLSLLPRLTKSKIISHRRRHRSLDTRTPDPLVARISPEPRARALIMPLPSFFDFISLLDRGFTLMLVPSLPSSDLILRILTCLTRDLREDKQGPKWKWAGGFTRIDQREINNN